MRAVILAAGKGSRLKPLTLSTPKPLIQIEGKTLLERVLGQLPPTINRITIVINYLGDKIIEHVGHQHRGRPISYHTQNPLNGTAGALWQIQDQITEPTLVINSDDLYHSEDLNNLIKHPKSLLFFETEQTRQSSPFVKDEIFKGLGQGTHVVCGAYVVGPEFFSVEPTAFETSRGTELGLPQTLAALSSTHTYHAVKARRWLPVGTHEQLQHAQDVLCKK